MFRNSWNSCPYCSTLLVTRPLITSHETRQCDSCNGLWISHESMASLAEGLAATVESHARSNQSATSLAETPKTLHCPACMTPLKPQRRGSVVTDECPRHGIWLEYGELQAMLSQQSKD